jgi:uncharacterized protein (DUF3084 family)
MAEQIDYIEYEYKNLCTTFGHLTVQKEELDAQVFQIRKRIQELKQQKAKIDHDKAELAKRIEEQKAKEAKEAEAKDVPAEEDHE